MAIKNIAENTVTVAIKNIAENAVSSRIFVVPLLNIVILLALLMAGCRRSGKADFTLQRQIDQVRMGASRPLAAVTSNSPQSFPEGTLATTDNTGQALIKGKLDGQSCQVFLFFTSSLQKKACPKATFSGGSASCVEEGSAVFSQCSSMLVMTPSGEVQMFGTWVWATYLPGQQVSVVLVSDGRAAVRPVTDAGNYQLGPETMVEAGQFYYTTPDAMLPQIPGLEPRRAYPWERLPELMQYYPIEGWMQKASQTAGETGVPFPEPGPPPLVTEPPPQPGGLPDLVARLEPADFRPEDRQLVSEGVKTAYVPVNVLVENHGSQPAEIFKVSIQGDSVDGRYPRPFLVAGSPDRFYAFTSESLPPGGRALLHGLVALPAELVGQKVTLTAFADSCEGEEFSAKHCRIQEADEGNNVSNSLDVVPEIVY